MGRRLLLVPLIGLVAGAVAPAPHYDIVIRHGQVVDGTGRPAFAADVAVKAGRIVAVGTVTGTGAREIEARGRLVTPGFIDMMDQSGEALLKPGAGENKLRMGVTTLFAGEAGTPVAAGKIAGYLDTLQRQGIALNFGTSYSVAQPWIAVIGDKAGTPSPAQLAQMQAMVATAMREGVFGVTSALIYPPLSYMDTAVVTALARPAGACGGFYSTHMRDEGKDLVKAIDEAIAIGEGSGTKVEIYHLKAAWKPLAGQLMPAALQAIAAARARGVDVAADMYLYQAGGTGLEITVPNWVWADGFDAGLARLRDPAVRQRLKAEVAAGSQPGWSNLVMASGGWDHVMMANAYSLRWDTYRYRMIGDIARAEGMDPEDVAWDIVLAAAPNRALGLYFQMDEPDIELAVKAPFVSIGSDAAATLKYGDFDAIGLPHPRSYGNAVRLIAEYVKRRPVIDVPTAVRKMTGWPAERMGLADRGLIKPGMQADLVVLDYATIDDVADWQHTTAAPTGIETVIVNGQLAFADGAMTAARGGQVLRHQCRVKKGDKP
ncbi:N-acyl-D-amino-acid deacylase family protein [Sandarakinorhabdus limnophila]|uniref:N-acyl-D-amino-acid deacylase family protein n=1 Tax=Sandarakinorhabdus limnophila TaxID=210512 RepID=UPI0026EBF4A1|nr:amidohydrolase family protein [Sandarakinorhabdus limnophila]